MKLPLALSPTQIGMSGLLMRCYQIQHMPVASLLFVDNFEKHDLMLLITDMFVGCKLSKKGLDFRDLSKTT